MNERIKILHVEDDEIDHTAVIRLIRNGGLPYGGNRVEMAE